MSGPAVLSPAGWRGWRPGPLSGRPGFAVCVEFRGYWLTGGRKASDRDTEGVETLVCTNVNAQSVGYSRCQGRKLEPGRKTASGPGDGSKLLQDRRP